MTTTITSTSRSTNKHLSAPSPKHWYVLSTIVSTLPTTTIMTTARLPSWSGSLVDYQRGDDVMYNGMKYRCVTSHRSYVGAQPSPLTWALWRKIE